MPVSGRHDSDDVDVLPVLAALDPETQQVAEAPRPLGTRSLRHFLPSRRCGKRVVGGTRLTDGALAAGNFFAPTLITNASRDMLFTDEETFGPVAFVQAFDTEEEVIGKANDTQYGLAAYVLTRDLDRALRVCEAIRAGTVALHDDVPSNTIAPFGGFKMSGLGRECSTEGIEAFL